MRIVIMGPAGRVGKQVVQEALKRRIDFMIVGGVVPVGRPYVRQDIGKATETGFVGATLYDELEFCIPIAQGVIDFTKPEATMETIKKCVEYKRPLVIGTRGFDEKDIQRIKFAATKIPIFMDDNISRMAEGIEDEDAAAAVGALNALLFLKDKLREPGMYNCDDALNGKQ